MKFNEVSSIIKYKGICNIIRVLNIQQEENSISGMKHKDYSKSKEMFAVYTDDRKFQKLYRYNEMRNILPDLLRAGYISYADYYEDVIVCIGTVVTTRKRYELLEEELNDYLMALSSDEFRGVCYSREELGWYQNQLCVVHGGMMHWKGANLPAFQYRDSLDSKLARIEKCIGNVEMFKKDIKPFIEDFPLVQLIFAYYLSGAIRQVLELTSEGVGEYGLVACITGKTGAGKTTVTTTLQNVLFGKGRMVNNNVTSIGLYRIIRSSGICPVVRDDSSTDTQNSLSHLKDKVLDIYNIASGKCRITSNSEIDVPLYAPFIESREEYWSLSDVVKSIRQVEGYKFRILELYCNKEDLTEDAQSARRFAELNGKYSGMAVVFLDYLVDSYSEQKLKELYQEYVKEMDVAFQENELESRYANRTAVIMTAARICEEAYGIQMDLGRIKKVMIEAIHSFERRLEATPENWELKQLYRRFTEKNCNGLGVNDQFIVDLAKNYNHKQHYAAFSKKNPDEFYIPKELIGYFIADGALLEPRFWGYDKNRLKTDMGELDGEHWKAVLKEWAGQGILITRSGQSGTYKTVKMGGVDTNCYHFNWRKIAQQFGDDGVLDMTRFAHDTVEEMKEKEITVF